MTHPKLPIALLGIAVSNTTLEETIEKIQAHIEQYRKNPQPRYAATLYVDSLVNIHSCFSHESRNPELLHILRESNIVTIDSAPLAWISGLLGSSIVERIAGADLLPKLAESLAQKKQSFFLLGGEEKTLKLCMLYLQALYPDVRIVGALHSKIHIENEVLGSAEERDSLIIEQINRTAPDVLFINLGSGKQDIWFERIRNKIRVPVSIGIGSAFDLLTGMAPRAPKWMQQSGLEWFFKLIQEPRRMFKRYVGDLIKFPLLFLPLIIYHTMNKLLYKAFHLGSQTRVRSTLLFISSDQTIAVLPLPGRINDLVAKEIRKNWDDLFSQDIIILDFGQVGHIDLEGMALFLHMWRRAAKEKKHMYALGITSDIQWLFRLHRMWDYLSAYACKTPGEVMSRLLKIGAGANFYDAIQQERNHVIISIFGRLDYTQNFNEYMKRIGPILYQKNCILDLSYCTYVDNTGIGFLLKLRKAQPQHFISLSLHGLSRSISQQLKRAKVYHLFKIIPNLGKLFE